MESEFAPIVLFTYNRPWHIRQTIEALQKNILAQESDLFIYSDGVNNLKKGHPDLVREVRRYIATIDGFKSVTIIERNKNFGVSSSIINGVTEIVDRFGKIIVLEDDIVTSPFFLKYMNEALNLYEHEHSVISIHGYIYPISGTIPDTFFLRGADCWGWATWRRGWNIFEPDGKVLLAELIRNKAEKIFDFNGSFQYVKMLRDQISGKNDSWAIRWYASAFLKECYTLYPGQSYVKNIGTDSSGTHCRNTKQYDAPIPLEWRALVKIPVIEDTVMRGQFESYFRSITSPLMASCFNIILKACFK